MGLMRKAKTLFFGLIEPFPSITDPVERWHGQLIAGVMVLLLPFGYLVAVFPLFFLDFESLFDSDLVVLSGTSLIWVLAYYWSRSGRAQHSALLIAWSASIAILIIAATDSDPSDVLYLLMPLLFSSVIIAVRSTLVLMMFDLTCVFLIAILLFRSNTRDIIEFEFSFLVIGSVMILIVNWYRDRLEQDREQSFAASADRLRIILEKMPVMLAAVAENGTLAAWNTECERVTGYRETEIIGNPAIAEVLFPHASDQIERWQTPSHSYRDWEWDIRCKDGTLRTIAWSSIAAQQPIAGWMTWGVGVDVTARRRAEEQRLELAIERQRIAVLKQFLDTASHDLRTPLTTLKTSLYLLEQVAESDKIRHHITVAETQANRLAQLLEDMLEAVRVDTLVGEGSDTLQPLDLNVIIDQILVAYEGQAKVRHLQLRFTPHDAPLIVFGDPRGLRISIGNIVENAVKFSLPYKPVTLHAFRDDDYAAVAITDAGMGISAKHLPRIFEHFYRIDPARQATTGGAGLGLTVAKRIVQAHGGQIDVKSEVGYGSTFIVRLPLSVDQAKPSLASGMW